MFNVSPYSFPSELKTEKLLCAMNTDMSYNGIIMIPLNCSLLQNSGDHEVQGILVLANEKTMRI